MVKVLYGQEPYLIDFYKKKLLKDVEDYALNVFEEWSDDIDFYSSHFFDKVAFVFKCAVPTKSKVLCELLDDDNENILILFLPGEAVDKRTAIIKEMERKKVLIDCKKINVDRAIVFLKEKGLDVRYDVAAYLLKRMGYVEDPSVSLYTVEIAARKLILCNESITKDLIDREVAENITSKIFELFDLLLKRNYARYFDVYNEISREQNTISILSVLLRAARIGYKAKVLGVNAAAREIGVSPAALKSSEYLSKDILLRFTEIFQSGVNSIKAGTDERIAFIRATLCSFELLEKK